MQTRPPHPPLPPAPHGDGEAEVAVKTLGPTSRAQRALPIAAMSAGMVTRQISVHPSDVVFLKGIVEASDGLCAIYAERGGDLTIVAPMGRDAELAELVDDLTRELALPPGGRS